MKTLIAFDSETTGVDAGSRLIELAGIKFTEEGEVLDRFVTLVDPGMPLPADAAAVNSLSDDVLRGAPDAKQAISDFLEWAGDNPTFVAHFAQFDCGILAWEAQRAGIELPYSAGVIDTWSMAKAHGVTKNNKLTTLVEYHGIKTIGDAHRAMSDADSCAQYFLKVRGVIKPNSVAWELTGYDYGYPDELPPMLAALPELVAAGRPLSMTYRDAKEQVTDRTIIPYGWAQKADALYLHGMCALRKERRTFKADRIVAVEVV